MMTPPNVVLPKLLVLILRLVDRIDFRRPLVEIDLIPLGHAEVLGMYFHRRPFSGVSCSFVRLAGCFASRTDPLELR
jgi:hypothetical protein